MTHYWNGVQWDRLRPFNSGMYQDLALYYRWDHEHPGGEFKLYSELIGYAIKNNWLVTIKSHPLVIKESGEVAKLVDPWKMLDYGGQVYRDGNRSAFYRVNEYGKSVWRGEIAFQYDYWMSDKTLNYTSPAIHIHDIRDGFDLRTVRKLYLRTGNPGSPPPNSPPPPPPAPTPPPRPTPPPAPPPPAESREERIARIRESIRREGDG